jgi:hypothetical protein
MSFGGPHLLASVSSMLGVRPGMNVSVQNPPEGFMEKFLPLPDGVVLLDHSRTGVDLTVFFAQKKVELIEKMPALIRGMAALGCIWVVFPHALEGPQVPSEDFVRLAALEAGLTDTKKLLLDPAWTGLKLQWKPRPPRPEIPRASA